ncbi:hypothetical protein ACTI_27950 [Actinoplanes sp. OR16]|nr:hypothetical protein ACTI_27950 [Actinoplanes sp. OR16]
MTVAAIVRGVHAVNARRGCPQAVHRAPEIDLLKICEHGRVNVKSHASRRNPPEKGVVECDVGALDLRRPQGKRPMPCRSRGGGGASRIEGPDV